MPLCLRRYGLAGLVLTAMMAGCDGNAPQLEAIRAERNQAQQQVKDCQKEVAAIKEELAVRDKQIEILQALGPKRLEKLYHITSITLGNYTGGYDSDGKPGGGQPGDDSIKVFMEPRDQTGSVIKAAGEVTIQVFDLAQPEGKNKIAECKWSSEELDKTWSGGFGVYHFGLLCPWKERPRHEDLTVRVVFVDYLTGREHAAQKAVKVHLPAQ